MFSTLIRTYLYSNEIFKRKDNNLRMLMSCSDIARTISFNETFL